MESYRKLLLALSFGVFAIIHLVQAQPDQQGFISLDCGLPLDESPYTDPVTGLTYSSDINFIQNGKRGEADATYIYKQYRDLRYFPDGIRNCYNLTVNKGINYLIRAGFSYGNYDGLNVYPVFDLHVGPNKWITVDLEFENDREVIYMSKSNLLQICLIKTGETIPMISTLELRPLRNDSYMTQLGPLNLIYRRTYTSDSFGLIRYPNDVFDRKWDRFNWVETNVNTTLNVTSSNPFAVPDAVSRSGISPRNASNPLYFYLYPDADSDKVNVYFHFAEIQTLKANDTREFDILLDENIIQKAYSPKVLQSETVYNISPQKCKFGSCDLDLVRTERSTLPPFINAIEGFSVLEFLYAETNPNDVAAMKNIQETYGLNIISWQGDPCVPELLKWEDIKCSYTNKSTPPRIISLDLSSRGLKGVITPAFQNLTELRKLDLSNNSFTGGVPEFLASMKSLSIINLNWNNLTGPLPKAFNDREKNGLKLTIQGNPKFCVDASCKNNNQKYVLAVVASAASVLIIVVVLILLFVFKKRRPRQVDSLPTVQHDRELPSRPSIFTQTKRFTYSEVVALTDNFERVLGEGGFGVVYHGSLNGTQPIAVKLLSQSSVQGYKEFKAEVELLLRVHHVNLVSLVGYCDEDSHLALLYEYAPNGDLKQHLSGERGGSPLKWSSRLKIVVETAQGLEYLHTGCQPPMVHRDVKTTNILLDEHFQAKLADFGLSRSFPIGGETHVSTVVAGTPGYLDPEYYQTNRLNEKSDVYSFGIVLLEIITSRPVIQQTRERTHIAAWVGYMLTKGDIESIVDPRLNRDYEPTSVWKALEIAMSCVNPSSEKRPTMSQVTNELKQCLTLDNSRRGGRQDMGSRSSVEVSTSFTTEVTPSAR
ncbi:probable LRR receptor-like serine/threonine-protein kinase At2g28960 isoform X2 [Arabidopsis lyrata subsp. lyrata]|uniref:probable LRR receptor-like serine/threonine-protein kinase At2g28960 isoform X2 n=1 Tax=Arabidopsis lyrata subsp. lyrata TaxID=81972 RepID=UPI000A29DBD9|nr:probable LRR receptor-like serine/threonine-protein kinase At2g28960 isoform X2 [Arabidopsis lyrata subsp. lyrata]|eukprot:XP_020883009.1 probable LRR receptor-like serine/threonine-protein kinase At2g28960 isoform X2 [Arabidopsis lyrata subsp. lyrata]